MRKARTPLALLTAILVIGTVAIAAQGIEVLTIVPDGPGYWVETWTPGAAIGYTMEAVTTIDGQQVVVDTAPIDEDGIAWVRFPAYSSSDMLIARDQAGAIVFTAYQPYPEEFEGIFTND